MQPRHRLARDRRARRGGRGLRGGRRRSAAAAPRRLCLPAAGPARRGGGGLSRRCSRAFPDDCESWNNLGNVRAASGDVDGAVAAFRRAIALRPDIVEMVLNLSDALGAGGAARGAGGGDARGGAGSARTMPRVQTELGLAAAEARDFDGGRARLSRGDPARSRLHLRLCSSSACCSRISNRRRRSRRAGRQAAPAAPELGFLKAWALRRQGAFAEALPLAEAAPADDQSGAPRAIARRDVRPARRAGARLRRLRRDEPRRARRPAGAGRPELSREVAASAAR